MFVNNVRVLAANVRMLAANVAPIAAIVRMVATNIAPIATKHRADRDETSHRSRRNIAPLATNIALNVAVV